ncbi:hypothetical protein [Azospirillum brasilense]|uniref:hypothetical protein n=1 Tax=Azospirillum brasilense TaxID=192 RepID=UPI0014791529|nr:hypothetical protein [Azospirillum brasilense]
MRKIRAVLRVTFACGLSKRQVAPIAEVSATTVREYVTAAAGHHPAVAILLLLWEE